MTAMFTSASNQGLQVVNNTGAMEAHIYAERPKTPPQPSCVVPHRRNPDFVDRNELLEQIHQQCSAPTSRVVLVGLGGVGYVGRKKIESTLVSDADTGSPSWLQSIAIGPPCIHRIRGYIGHS